MSRAPSPPSTSISIAWATPSSSFPNNLEINAIGASKVEAILRLASYLGIRPEETMGFGDGENDISMIRMAGIGVAM